MLDAVPLLAVTTVLIFCFLYIFANLQLENIRNNWDEMRCEMAVVAISHMVPDGKDPNVDPTKFAVDNFQFCLTRLMDASLALAMAPIMGVFQNQVKATGPIQTSMNLMRSSAASLIQPLTSMFNTLWQKLMVGVYMITRIFQKMYSAFDRVFSILVATIFAGVGMYKGINNFINLVILVIIIIMNIILGLMIFAMPYVLPVMPIVITTLTAISMSISLGTTVVGLSDAFCVFPGTLVATANGWKAVEELKPGDPLRHGFVEGILKTTGKNAKCVSIDGVRISESHLVYDESVQKWKSGSQHTLAQATQETTDFLYCLNTTTRSWIVKGAHSELSLRDWEEMPVNSENDLKWEKHIYSILNDNKNIDIFPFFTSPGRGLLASDTWISTKSKGMVPISDIQIGDYVKDSYNSYTEVLGTYMDVAKSSSYSGPNSAVWVWNSDLQLWVHPTVNSTHKENSSSVSPMLHLITKSGMFMIDDNVFVRDFTEVGADKISETYDFIEDLLSDFST